VRWLAGLVIAVLGVVAVWLFLPGEAEPAGGALRVLRGGAEVEISGPLSTDLAKSLRGLGAVPLVQLDSVGGSRAGALAIADAIRAGGSETVVTDRCLSVCAAAFMAGRRRWIGPFATVGLDAESSAVYRRAGVPDALVTEAMAAPPGQTSVPTKDEIVRAGLATDQARPDQFALGGFGPAPTPASIRDRLLGVPLYRAVALADPDGFRSVVDRWSVATLNGESGTVPFRDMQALLSRSFSAALRQAPDELLLIQAELFRDELAWMQRHEPALCGPWAAALGGLPGPTDDDLVGRRRALELAVLSIPHVKVVDAPFVSSKDGDCAHVKHLWTSEAVSADAIRSLLRE
jgi:hypothetical protein